ncbi:hypothetical protein [Propioniciclava soli]|uniref:Uncharacterized protein n=1 Tax=Propioniciclava soli TaxID=2775081 RepID=A0ABZ3C753_9ACTN|nr:hypothetical protein [Propioniciclava soli]
MTHPVPTERTDAAPAASVAEPAIGTVAASKDATTDPRTGEPRRPWSIYGAAALLYLGVAVVFAGLLWAFWQSIDTFAEAAWLHRVTPTEPGSLIRVAMVSGEFVVALVIGAAGIIAAHHAWWGYRWARIAGLIAVALSCAALIINPLASAGIAFAVLGAILLWLPPSRAFFARWHLRRHPGPPVATITDDVYYGPLPRYR